MAELVPAPFPDLVARLHREPATQDALFELPRRKWYFPSPGDPDLSVRFHDHVAGNPSGPAAGPHTQMAQNLLLSYVAGGRILELKTVQVLDQLEISRPCIDMTNIGFNIEWSQELRVEQSLDEYVAGAMLIEMFRRGPLAGGRLEGLPGDVILDLSVGYDLAGIRSEKVRRFLEAMRDATPHVARLRDQIPAEFAAARDLRFPTRLSNSITLSTFHGCPAGEIESICEFLIGEMDFDVIVKMNPPTLGRERLEGLLYDTLGYTHLKVNPKAYGAAITFDESIGLCDRLTAFARQRGRRLGFKFSNTLEVLNQRDFFKPENEIQYLSGQPLHVITMTLTDEFRRAVGPHIPISFSAGIDHQNFALAAACGFVPITSSTDLLRPGGYARLGSYLSALANDMKRHGAANLDEFILRRFGHAAEAERRARAMPGGADDLTVAWAGLLNTTSAADEARRDPRYHARQNAKVPRRIDSHLKIFDCVTCDKCLPVCPNAANFKYPTPVVAFDYRDIAVESDGSWSETGEPRRFAIEQSLQIACYADFCNECGNCDTFCPEYGGPYIEKPSFHGTHASYVAAAPRDGFFVESGASQTVIRGRLKSREYELCIESPAAPTTTTHLLRTPDGLQARFRADDHTLLHVAFDGAAAPLTIDMWAYHTLRHLLAGVLNGEHVNQVNAGIT